MAAMAQNVRLDINTVSTDNPVEATIAHICLSLTIAADDRGESCTFLDTLYAGIDDLPDSGGFVFLCLALPEKYLDDLNNEK